MNTLFTSGTRFLQPGIDTEKRIEFWNLRVNPEDTVFVVGNFISLRDMGAAVNVVKRLNGTINLVYGPEDTRNLCRELEHRCGLKFSALGPVYTLSGENAGTSDKVILSFWPFEHWLAEEHGSWHLHGGVAVASLYNGKVLRRRLSVQMSEVESVSDAWFLPGLGAATGFTVFRYLDTPWFV